MLPGDADGFVALQKELVSFFTGLFLYFRTDGSLQTLWAAARPSDGPGSLASGTSALGDATAGWDLKNGGDSAVKWNEGRA